MGNNVYLLFRDTGDHSELQGVYSTIEKGLLEKDNPKFVYYISEYKVDW